MLRASNLHIDECSRVVRIQRLIRNRHNGEFGNSRRNINALRRLRAFQVKKE